MSYESTIVKKPWGYEYLAYENEHAALWFLYIKDTHSTSLHCHPKKTTGLVLLDGGAEVSFVNNINQLSPGNKVMIRKGLFHSTRATHEKGAFVFEIETPVDKQDLVRFKDSYGREGKPYEDSTHEMPKAEDCLWIEDPKSGESKDYNFANCVLTVQNISSIDELHEIEDNYNIMFLNGGLQADYDQNVAGPGDIVVSKTIKHLTSVFTKIAPNTVIMIIKPNE
jgi:mannose-6-phosphate isomerase-like protein (cupin superfamily)